jgi:hypothetical protein
MYHVQMIWFACKQCGKKQSRPKEQVGTLVFCTCGQANRVPWDSEPGAEESPPPRAFPKVWVDDSEPPRRPASPWGQSRQSGQWGQPQLPPPPTPGYCFNHAAKPAAGACSSCLVEFCDDCLVKLGDQVLCGPCKNFRILSRTRPPRISGYAISALVIGIVGGPITGCMTLSGIGAAGSEETLLALSVLGVVLPVTGLALGAKALYDINAGNRIGGRSLAVMGLVASAVGVLWCVTMIGIVAYRMAGG